MGRGRSPGREAETESDKDVPHVATTVFPAMARRRLTLVHREVGLPTPSRVPLLRGNGRRMLPPRRKQKRRKKLKPRRYQ